MGEVASSAQCYGYLCLCSTLSIGPPLLGFDGRVNGSGGRNGRLWFLTAGLIQFIWWGDG